MDWNETLRSASFQVNCIPGLNEAAAEGPEDQTKRGVPFLSVSIRVIRVKNPGAATACGKYLASMIVRGEDSRFCANQPPWPLVGVCPSLLGLFGLTFLSLPAFTLPCNIPSPHKALRRARRLAIDGNRDWRWQRVHGGRLG